MDNVNANKTKMESKESSTDFKIHRRTVFYGLALLPTFVYALVVIIYFELSVSKQEEINKKLNFGYAPFIAVRIMNCLILFCHLIMLFGVWFNSKFPELALNASFQTILIALVSSFVIFTYVSTLKHFERRVKKFDIKSFEEREITKQQLEFLIDFQEKNKCCGMESYTDYSKEEEKYNAPKAEPDTYPINDTTAKPIQCRFELSWKQWLDGNDSVEKFMQQTKVEKSSKIYKAVQNGLPKSCCINKDSCNSDSGDSTSTNIEEKVYLKGCKNAILANLVGCTSTVLLINLYIMPWIVTTITLMICWAHLRTCQGTTWRNFGSVKNGPDSTNGKIMDEPGETTK